MRWTTSGGDAGSHFVGEVGGGSERPLTMDGLPAVGAASALRLVEAAASRPVRP